MKRSIFISVGFAAAVAVVNLALFWFAKWPIQAELAIAYIYMIGLSIAFHSFISPNGDPKKFVTAYMAFTGGRLFLSLFVILAFALINREYMKPFAVSFLLLYFSFSALEISRLWGQLKK